MKKIHRAFNTFYLLAKNSFSAVEGGEGGWEVGGGGGVSSFLGFWDRYMTLGLLQK